MEIPRAADLVSLTDAAVELRISRERAMRLIQTGRLTATRLCGRWLVERASMERVRQELSPGAQPAPELRASA